MKKIILLLAMIILLSSMVIGANCGDGVGACACGDTLTASYTMTGDMSCNTSGSALTIGANNIYLDCNGARIYGNSSGRAIYSTSTQRSNITIKNCILNNYTYGVYFNKDKHSFIINNTIYNITNSSPYSAIVVTGAGLENISIINNSIYKNYHGINIDGSNVSVIHNYIQDSGYHGITVSKSLKNITLQGNIINRTYWNGLDINSIDSKAMNNIIVGASHHCIDLFDTSTSRTKIMNVEIYNNTCTWVTDTDANGIYMFNVTSSLIYDNIITSAPNYAIGIDGWSNTTNNSIQNNTFSIASTSTNWCLVNIGVGNLFYNNTFSSCNNKHIRLLSNSGLGNITFNGTVNEYLVITLSTGGNITLNYTGKKEFIGTNETINIYGANNNVTYTIHSGESWEIKEDNNTLPYSSMVTTEDTTLCNGRYYRITDITVDTGHVLDGNGVILNGVGAARAIYTGFRPNTIITNLTIEDYITGVNIYKTQNVTLKDTIFYNNSRSVYLQYSKNATISNITCNESFGTSQGCIANAHSNDTFVEYAEIYQTRQNAINIFSNSYNFEASNINITDNGVDGSDQAVYSDSTSNNLIFHDMNIYRGSHNHFDLQGDYNTIYNIMSIDPMHHWIDLYEPGDVVNNNTIYNSTVTWTNSLINASGIYAVNSSDNTIHNNTITNVPTSDITTNGWGIVLSGGENSKNSIINENTITNSESYGIVAEGVNNEYKNNILNNNLDVRISSSFNKYGVDEEFINNVYSDSIGKYYIDISGIQINATINESSTTHIINLSNNAMIKWIGTKRKYFSIQNISTIIKHLAGINDIFNSSQATPTYSDTTAQINETLDPNDRLFIFTYATANDPRPTSIATTIMDVDYSYSSTNKIFYWNQTGSGSSTFIGFTSVEGDGGAYEVWKNGVFIEYSTSDTYTTTGAGRWEFGQIGVSVEEQESVDDSVTSLNTFIDKIGTIVTIFIAGIILTVLANIIYQRKLTIDLKELAWVSIMLIVFSIILVYGIQIIGDII